MQETDSFVQLAAVAGIAVPDEIQDNRRRMYRLVNNYLNSEDFDNLLDHGAEVTQGMLNLLDGWFPPPEPVIPAEVPAGEDAGGGLGIDEQVGEVVADEDAGHDAGQ